VHVIYLQVAYLRLALMSASHCLSATRRHCSMTYTSWGIFCILPIMHVEHQISTNRNRTLFD
jgi:hypothetical protein